MEKCESCPLKRFSETKNLTCISVRHPRYCTLSSQGSSHDEAILRKSAKSLKEEEIPGLLARLKNASVALLNVANHARKGEKIIVPPEVKQSRLDICYQCDHYMANLDKCGKCGCALTDGLADGIPPKTAVASESCPEGYWSQWQEPQIALKAIGGSSKSSGCGCSG